MGIYHSLGKEQITAIGTAATKSFTLPSGVASALCRVGVAAVRWSCSSTAPTATLGFPQNVGEVFEVEGGIDLMNFKVIAQTVTNAVLDVEYFGV